MSWVAESRFNSRDMERRLHVRFGADHTSELEFNWAVLGSDGDYVHLIRNARMMVLPGSYTPEDINSWVEQGRENPDYQHVYFDPKFGKYVQEVVIKPLNGGEPLL